MKKSIGLFCLFVGLVTLTGCPYSSDFPIDTPSVKVNPAWYGKYSDEMGATNFDYSMSTITISAKSDFEYKVEDYYLTKDSMDMDVEHRNLYTAYVSKVKGKTFINAQKQDEYAYYIYKVDVKGTDILLTELTDGWKKRVADSKELKDFLGKHISNDLLYGDVVTLKRM